MATAPGFSVAIVYESTDALERAKRFSIGFAAERAAEHSLDVSRWDFHLLGQRAIRNAAASTAAEADMVIVASSGINPLPARVEKWIEMWIWLVDRRKPTLVVLASTDHPAVASIRGYLAKCAASKGLPFVPHTDFTPADPRGDAEKLADAPGELARCRTSKDPLRRSAIASFPAS